MDFSKLDEELDIFLGSQPDSGPRSSSSQPLDLTFASQVGAADEGRRLTRSQSKSRSQSQSQSQTQSQAPSHTPSAPASQSQDPQQSPAASQSEPAADQAPSSQSAAPPSQVERASRFRLVDFNRNCVMLFHQSLQDILSDTGLRVTRTPFPPSPPIPCCNGSHVLAGSALFSPGSAGSGPGWTD